MDESFFSSRIQSIVSQMMLRLMDRLSQSTEAPKPSWIHAGPVGTAPAGNFDAGGNFEALIREAAQRYSIDPDLVESVVRAESGFNPQAVSQAGAMGLMQLMPGTAAGLGVENPFDPQENVFGGAKLLRQLLNRYDGNVSLALAAYNAGPGAVDRFGGIPPYSETQTYVSRVLQYYQTANEWSA